MKKAVVFFMITVGLWLIGCSNSFKNEEEKKTDILRVVRAPAAGELVSIFDNISLTFSIPLDSQTIDNHSIYITDETNVSIGAYLDFEESNPTKVLIVPFQYFQPSTSYTVVVTTNLKSKSGLSLSENYEASFTTKNENKDDSNLTFVGSNPKSGIKGVQIFSKITLAFNKDVSPAPLYTQSDLYHNECNNQAIQGSVDFFNNTVTFVPASTLPYGADCNLSLTGELQDMYAKAYDPTSNPTNWTFQVIEKGDTKETVPNKGFLLLNTLPVGTKGYKILSLNNVNKSGANGVEEGFLLIANEKGVILVKGYTDENATPKGEKLAELSIPSEVTDMKEVQGGVALTTKGGEFYILGIDVNATLPRNRLYQIQKIDKGEMIYGVSDDYYIPQRLAIVGPFFGMDIFEYNASNTSQPLKRIKENIHPSNSETMLKVVTTNETYPHFFVTDYKGSILKFDQDGTYLDAYDINGSIKEIFYNPFSQTATVFTNFGKIVSIENNGTIKEIVYMAGTPGNVALNTTGGYTFISIIDKYNGVYLIENRYNDQNSTVSLIQPKNETAIDAAFVGDPYNDVKNYLLVLTQDGKLLVYNGKKDTYFDGENLYSTPYYGQKDVALDVNITLNFYNEYLDLNTTKTTNGFVLLDRNDSDRNVSIDIRCRYNAPSAEGAIPTRCVITPSSSLRYDTTYLLKIPKGGLKDRLGNTPLKDINVTEFTTLAG